MSVPQPERRRWPRVPVAGSGELTTPVSVSVRLMDVSRGGVLLAAGEPFEPGQHAWLRARLAEQVLSTEVEIRHVDLDEAARNAYRLGARFLLLDEAAQQAMGQLIGRDREARDRERPRNIG